MEILPKYLSNIQSIRNNSKTFEEGLPLAWFKLRSLTFCMLSLCYFQLQLLRLSKEWRQQQSGSLPSGLETPPFMKSTPTCWLPFMFCNVTVNTHTHTISFKNTYAEEQVSKYKKEIVSNSS